MGFRGMLGVAMAIHRPNPETDPFRPPAIPTEVFCMHCQQEYESYLMEWREEIADDGRRDGFWCCPTPGCDGKGFGFDIFPIDPDYCDEHGQPMSPFGEEEDEEGDEFDAEWTPDDDGDTFSPWIGEPIDADALLHDDEPDAPPAGDENAGPTEPFDDRKPGPTPRRPWTDDDLPW